MSGVIAPAAIPAGSGLSRFFHELDRLAIEVGSYHVSLWSILVFFVVLAGLIVFARLGSLLARKLFARITRLDPAQQVLGEKLVSIAFWTLAILVGIDILGINLTTLTVFSGAFGLAVGFGLQKTIGNLIAGIILLMDRSIKPGDVIAVADAAGRESFGQVKKIGIRAVSVTTRDHREYLIPNENLMINQVENWSYSSRQVRMQVQVTVSYRTDLDLAERLMLEAARSCKRVLETPPPTAWLESFAENGVQFVIHCWIVDPEQGVGNVRSEVLKSVWRLFKEHGVAVPLPQRDINLRDSEAVRDLLAALERR